MTRFFATLICAALSVATTAQAEGRDYLGNGRLVNNDLFGDTKDRWQTGSVAASRYFGSEWTGALPDRPFDLLEFRIGGQIVAPANLQNPAAGDRPFAGLWSFGLHTQFARGAAEYSLGGDLVIMGPQTKLDELQTGLHDALGVAPASAAVLNSQIGNNIYGTFVGEMGRNFELGEVGHVRPFTEVRYGHETMARVGFDVTFGSVGQGALLARDPVTGQRYRALSDEVPGFSYVFGGDIAYVNSSALLPEDQGFEVKKARGRARAGVHWQGENNAVFYGVTWLSEEFEGQPNGQAVGSLRLDLNF